MTSPPHHTFPLVVIVLLSLLFLATTTQSALADPYTIVSWYEEAQSGQDVSFNIRFTPLHVNLETGDSIRIFLPAGTKTTVDGVDLRCTLHSSGNRRYYFQPSTYINAKRAGSTAGYIDVIWDGEWFDSAQHNLLIRCFGVGIDQAVLNAKFPKQEQEQPAPAILDTDKDNNDDKSTQQQSGTIPTFAVVDPTIADEVLIVFLKFDRREYVLKRAQDVLLPNGSRF